MTGWSANMKIKPKKWSQQKRQALLEEVDIHKDSNAIQPSKQT